MTVTKVLRAASMVAMLISPGAFGANSVLGEKLDSGLGQLSASYTGAEFMKGEYRVAGESLDSGLGELSASYTAAEFQKQIIARR